MAQADEFLGHSILLIGQKVEGNVRIFRYQRLRAGNLGARGFQGWTVPKVHRKLMLGEALL